MTEAATAEYRASVQVPPEHPCLPGHFPGHPVVPGVLLVELVLETLRAWQGAGWQLRRLGSVKFLAPLLPGEAMDICLRLSGQRLEFTCQRAERLLAQGSCQIAPG